jgi:hypothetical protein
MKCCKTVKALFPVVAGVGAFVVGMGFLAHVRQARTEQLASERRTVAWMDRPAVEPAPRAERPSPNRPLESRPGSSGAASPGWAETMTQEFPADVYPSRLAAARGLALQLPRLLDEAEKESGSAIAGALDVASGDGATADLTQTFIAAAERLPDFKRPLQAARADRSEESASWTAELSHEVRDEASAPWDEDSTLDAGTIRLTLRHGPCTHEASADYDAKTWMTREADASAVAPGGKWVVAQSSAPQPTAAEAEDSARRAARDVLRRIIRDRSRERRFRNLDDGILADRLNAALFDNRDWLISDRFVQRFTRPYGDVWRVALLVDASDGALQRVAQEAGRMAATQREHRRVGFVATAGLLFVIIALYFILNAVTKGYFTWRLRGAAVVATVMTAVAMLALFA